MDFNQQPTPYGSFLLLIHAEGLQNAYEAKDQQQLNNWSASIASWKFRFASGFTLDDVPLADDPESVNQAQIMMSIVEREHTNLIGAIVSAMRRRRFVEAVAIAAGYSSADLKLTQQILAEAASAGLHGFRWRAIRRELPWACENARKLILAED